MTSTRAVTATSNNIVELNNKPTAIICKTFKGKNLGQKIEDKLDWHGKDLGENVK